MKKTSSIGRPKKNVGISFDEFKGIVDQPENSSAVVEFQNSFPFEMKQYLSTLESNSIETFMIDFYPTFLVIWGKTIERRYSDEYSDGDKNFLLIHYNCTNNLQYSYFCKRPTFVQVNNKSKFSSAIGDILEASKIIKFTINENIEHQLTIEIYNDIIGSVDIKHIPCDIEFDEQIRLPRRPKILSAIGDPICSLWKNDITEYKKLLNSKSKRKAVENKLSIIPYRNEIIITFKKDNNNEQEIIISKQKNKFLDIKIDEIQELNFPKDNIYNFLLHVKGKFDIKIYKDYYILQYIDKNYDQINKKTPSCILFSIISND